MTIKQNKYTKSAKGQICQVRLPGICNFDNDTTVLAHINGGGIGGKHLDIHAAYCCSSCHDVVDGRVLRPQGMKKQLVDLWFHEAVIRTQSIMVGDGLLIL